MLAAGLAGTWSFGIDDCTGAEVHVVLKVGSGLARSEPSACMQNKGNNTYRIYVTESL